MKKNLVIMLMMVLCAGFASAQTVNTVRGFVPAGSTGAGDNATYVVLGQPFSMMSDLNNTNEVMVGLAQMQLITDTTMTVVGYRDGYHDHGIDLTPQELLERLEDISACSEGNPAEGYQGFLNFQKPNLAHNNDNYEYYYDSLFVVKVYICPDSTSDRSGNKYEVIALNNKCWINSNLRTTLDCDGNSVEGMMYTSELNEVTEATLPTYGLLYTMAAAMGTATTADGTAASVSCDETTGYLQGICPCGWHLPTVAEMEPLFVLPAENLRVDGNWIVDGNNNLSGFSAEPAGFYNATFDRFEGLLTETDYWMVNCDSLENPVQDVFQLIYSCNTPLKPKHSTDDALSVRCVYDIIYAFDNCEPNPEPLPDPEPQPEPQPTPDPDCPTVSVSLNADYAIIGSIANYQANDVVTYNATVVFSNGSPRSYANESVTVQQDGTFAFTLNLEAPESPTNDEVEFSYFYGEIYVTRANTDCADTAEFDTRDNGCPSMDTGGEQFVDGVFSMSIWDYDPNYFEDVQVSFTYITEDGEQDPVSVVPSIDDGDESNEVILSATSPFTSITPEMQKVMVYVNFVFKDEYSYCAQEADYDFLNFSWECYPRCEDQDPAQVTSAGVSVVASNKISFELENYNDADVLRFDGTVYVTDGGVQQAIPVQSPTTGIYVLHTPNTNVWGYEYTPTSTTATVDSMKGYVRLNPDDICGTSAPFNTSSYNAVTPQEPTTGYTCPESLGSITAPSTTMEYDYYCQFNGDAEYIQEVAVTYLYYVPGNVNPDFTLDASNVNVQSGEITFSNPTEDAPQDHSFTNVDHILIQVHVTPVESCGSTPLDQTLDIYLN